MSEQLYTTRQMADVLPHLAGRHHNWAKYGLVLPTVSQQRPSRKGSKHTLADLVALEVIYHLFELGLTSGDIRAALGSASTFEGTGFECVHKYATGRQLSSFFQSAGFDYAIVIQRDFGGNAQLCICKNPSIIKRLEQNETGSLSIMQVEKIHDEIVRRLKESASGNEQ